MDVLDHLDWRILYELDMNGRASYSEIGKRLRTSKERVKYHIKKLEGMGVITSYYAVVDLAKLGFMQFRVYLKLEYLGKRGSDEIVSWLAQREDVWFVGSVSGNFHIAFGIYTKDIWEFGEFWNDLMKKYGNVVGWFQVCPMTSYTEFSRDYLLSGEKPERKEFTTFRKCEPVQIDETDIKILRALGKNARASLEGIARETGSSLMVVRYRIKRLRENRVLLGYRTLVDHRKLGYDYYKVDVVFGERKRGNEFRKHLLSHPNVVYTEETIQGSDFEFDLHVKGMGQLIDIMDEARAKFGKTMRQYWYYSMLKIHKSEYVFALPG